MSTTTRTGSTRVFSASHATRGMSASTATLGKQATRAMLALVLAALAVLVSVASVAALASLGGPGAHKAYAAGPSFSIGVGGFAGDQDYAENCALLALGANNKYFLYRCDSEGRMSDEPWVVDTEGSYGLTTKGQNELASNLDKVETVYVSPDVVTVPAGSIVRADQFKLVCLYGKSGTSVNERRSAFEEMDSLNTVVFLHSPDQRSSVSTIGNYAFRNCRSLSSVQGLANTGVTSIGKYAFSECEHLSSIEFPESLVTILDDAFSGCPLLETVTFNSNLKTISSGAFQNCAKLAALALPDALETIGDKAFSGCTGIHDITIPAQVSFIGSRAFGGCSNLATMTFEGVEPPSVEYASFKGMSSALVANVPAGTRAAYEKVLGGVTIVDPADSAAAENPSDASESTTPEAPVEQPSESTTPEAPAAQPSEPADSAAPSAPADAPRASLVAIAVPVGKSFTYDGKAHVGVATGTGYTLSGATSATKAGAYTATAKADAGHVFANGKKTAQVKWSIAKAKNKATAAKAKVKKTFKAKSLKKRAKTVALPKVSAKFGKAKWTVAKADKKHVLSLAKGKAKVKVKKGAAKGTYTIKLQAEVAGTSD